MFNTFTKIGSALALTLLVAAPVLAQNYVSGTGGTLFRTDNQGRNWRRLTTGVTTDINGVHAIGDTTFIVEGSRVRRSTDRGRTWAQVTNSGGTLGRFLGYPGVRRLQATSLTSGNITTSTNNGANWTGSTTLAGTGGFNDAKSIPGTNIGLVLGNGGRQIRRSTNAGASWTTAASQVNFIAIERLKDTIVLLSTSTGVLLRSTNRGLDFDEVTLPGKTATWAIQNFAVSPSQDTIVAVGDGGYVARSTDRGATWTRVVLNANSSFLTASFRTKDSVIIAGNMDNTGQAANSIGRNVWISADAGVTFTRVPIANFFHPLPSGQAPRNITDITWIAGTQIGYGTLTHRTNTNENILIRTTNGGLNWTTLSLAPNGTNLNGSRMPNIIHAISVDTILIAMNGAYIGDVYRSVDTGKTWTRTLNEASAKRAFYFVNNREGYLAGANGLWRTSNGGAAWTKITAASLLTNDLYALAPEFVAAAGGNLFYTTNYTTFTQLNPIGFSSGVLRALGTMPGRDDVYAAGDLGGIFRSNDQGATWQYIGDTLRTDNIRGIAFPTPAKGIAITQTGSMLRTADSGRTWSSQPFAPYRLNDIEFRTPAIGMIVGDSGLVYTTADSGATWTARYTGARNVLLGIYFGSDRDTTFGSTAWARIDTATNYAGINTEIPVRVRDFRNMINVQGTITWPAGKATYVGVTNIRITGMTATRHFRALTGNTGVQFSYRTTVANAVTLADSSVAFHLILRGNDTANAVIPLSFGNTPWVLGGVDSSNTTVNFTNNRGGALRIAPNPRIITGTPNRTTYCAGDTIRLPFTVTGGDFVPGNRFWINFSKADGTFSGVDTARGYLAGTTSGTVVGILPDTIRTGSNYRVRVGAIGPLVAGDTSATIITINARPTRPVITASVNGNISVCPGDSALLTAPAGFAGYTWSNGATTETLWAKAAGSYTVRVTNASGCISQASVARTVTLLTPPTATSITVLNNRTTICSGDSTQLTAANATANAYRWSTGATTRSIWVKTPGSYTVRVRTSPTGCFSNPSTAANIVVNPTPATSVITQGGIDTLISSTTGTSYIWQRNGVTVTGTNGARLIATQSGTYTVRVVSNGCTSAVSQGYVFVSAKPRLQATTLELYPNPASRFVDLKLGNLDRGSLTYQLIDATGRIVLTGETTTTDGVAQTRIELPNIASGIYTLYLRNGEASLATRLVIQP